MAKLLLDVPDVGAVFQHERGAGVAENVAAPGIPNLASITRRLGVQPSELSILRASSDPLGLH